MDNTQKNFKYEKIDWMIDELEYYAKMINILSSNNAKKAKKFIGRKRFLNKGSADCKTQSEFFPDQKDE